MAKKARSEKKKIVERRETLLQMISFHERDTGRVGLARDDRGGNAICSGADRRGRAISYGSL
jgi:ApbE superfamily uncharacterized protein (UPF0280 family)